MANQIIVNEKVPTTLLTSDFDYELPEELIAQSPAERRDGSRLMVVDRKKDAPEHRVFSDVIDYLRPEDILVVNSSKVIPARPGMFFGNAAKAITGGEWDTNEQPHL